MTIDKEYTQEEIDKIFDTICHQETGEYLVRLIKNPSEDPLPPEELRKVILKKSQEIFENIMELPASLISKELLH